MSRVVFGIVSTSCLMILLAATCIFSAESELESDHSPAIATAPGVQHSTSGDRGQQAVDLAQALMHAPSLEMRENVDFLLSPGAFVQQCMIAKGELTYANE